MNHPQPPQSPTPPTPGSSPDALSKSAGNGAPAARRIPRSTVSGLLTAGQPEGPDQAVSGRAATRDDRRDFFNEAMRETLGPLAGILERKINPILAALEAIPDEAERLVKTKLPAILDQPQTRALPLPVVTDNTPELRTLRPPGADPGTFETLCSRCRKCVEACPAQAIMMDPYQFVADGLPYIVPHSQSCVVCTELACMPACPTGALRVLDRFQINMGTARVDHEQCLRNHGEHCTICVDVCPITGEGTHPEKGDAIFIHMESGRIRVRKNVCIGCGLCENRCPTHPQAIQVMPYRLPVDPIIA